MWSFQSNIPIAIITIVTADVALIATLFSPGLVPPEIILDAPELFR